MFFMNTSIKQFLLRSRQRRIQGDNECLGDQHSQFFLSPLLLTSLAWIFIPFPLLFSPSTRRSLMGLPIVLKISVMLQLSLALHSTKGTPYLVARALPSAKLTWRSVSLQSTLLPTMTLHMDSGCDSLICLIQFSKLLKLLRSVTEQTRTTPAAPLQQVSVMVLNLYCPAVSQICILILMPSMLMVFILKSTPMVVTWDILYSSLTQRSRMLVLPTAVSPIMTSLTRQSYFSSSLLLVISIIPQLNNPNPPQNKPSKSISHHSLHFATSIPPTFVPLHQWFEQLTDLTSSLSLGSSFHYPWALLVYMLI